MRTMMTSEEVSGRAESADEEAQNECRALQNTIQTSFRASTLKRGGLEEDGRGWR